MAPLSFDCYPKVREGATHFPGQIQCHEYYPLHRDTIFTVAEYSCYLVLMRYAILDIS